KSVVDEAMASLKRKAAKQGYSPDHAMTKTVPDGFKVKGVSTFYDEDGKVRGQWVKSSADDSRAEEILKEFAANLAEGVKGLAPISTPPKESADDLLCVYP